MNRKLRIRHRRMLPLIAGLVGMLTVASLAVRKPPAVNAELPQALQVANATFDQPSIVVSVERNGGGLSAVVQSASETNGVASLYWSAQTAEPGARLPDDALFVGGVTPAGLRRYPLPEQLRLDGYLLLYSMNSQQIEATAPLRLLESAGRPG